MFNGSYAQASAWVCAIRVWSFQDLVTVGRCPRLFHFPAGHLSAERLPMDIPQAEPWVSGADSRHAPSAYRPLCFRIHRMGYQWQKSPRLKSDSSSGNEIVRQIYNPSVTNVVTGRTARKEESPGRM